MRSVMEDHFHFLKFAVGTLQSQITQLTRELWEERAARKETERNFEIQKEEIKKINNDLIDIQKSFVREINESNAADQNLKVTISNLGILNH